MTASRPSVRSAIIKKTSSIKIHFQERLKGVRIDEPVRIASARVAVDPTYDLKPISDPTAETVIEFTLPAGTNLTSAKPESPADALAEAERRQVERVLSQLRATSDKLLADRKTRIEHWQIAAVELAATLATRLLHREITTGEIQYDVMIRDMARQLGGDVPVSIRLHPDDIEILEKRLNGEPLLSRDADPRLVPDRNLSRGEVRIDGKDGVLVSNVTKQIQTMRAELLRGLGHART